MSYDLRLSAKSLGLFALAALTAGCASDRYLGSDGHKEIARGNFARAADIFTKAAKEKGVNQLLFMLDEASALFADRRFDEAIKVLLEAERLTEIKDYTSLSEEAGTLLTGDNVRTYSGEDFEKVLVNVYLAIAFAAVGKLEDAQVEARKINLILYRMINEGKRNYEESPFARYLSAMIWEAGRETNDAYIDYKKTAELDAHFPEIGRDLIATANRLRFTQDERRWREAYPTQLPRTLKADEGELVVFFERGLSPVKIPRDGQDSSLPRFIKRLSTSHSARLIVNGETLGVFSPVLDIENLSIRYLEDRIAKMIAKKLAGTAVKAAVAYGVGKGSKNSDAGWLTFMALSALDRADLRSWRSLPAAIEMQRVALKAGTYKVDLQVLSSTGEVLRTQHEESLVIPARKKIFRSVR